MKIIDPGISWVDQTTIPEDPISHGSECDSVWPAVADALQIAALWAVPPHLSINVQSLEGGVVRFHFPLNPLKNQFKLWLYAAGDGSVYVDQVASNANPYPLGAGVTTIPVAGDPNQNSQYFADIIEGPVMTATHADRSNYFVEELRIYATANVRVYGLTLEYTRASLTLPDAVT